MKNGFKKIWSKVQPKGLNEPAALNHTYKCVYGLQFCLKRNKVRSSVGSLKTNVFELHAL